jgi:hypothetical protein
MAAKPDAGYAPVAEGDRSLPERDNARFVKAFGEDTIGDNLAVHEHTVAIEGSRGPAGRSSAEPIVFYRLLDGVEAQFAAPGFPFVLTCLHIKPQPGCRTFASAAAHAVFAGPHATATLLHALPSTGERVFVVR